MRKVSPIFTTLSLALTLLVARDRAEPNLLIPDGGGSADPRVASVGSQAAASFFLGVSDTYAMLANVEVKKFADAMSRLETARARFVSSGEACGSVRAMIEKDGGDAKKKLVERRQLLKGFRVSYAKVGAIRDEETKEWTSVMQLADAGQLPELIGLCVAASTAMQKRLGEYGTLLKGGGPSPVASWRLMHEMESHVVTLRYGAIAIEGPGNPQ